MRPQTGLLLKSLTKQFLFYRDSRHVF